MRTPAASTERLPSQAFARAAGAPLIAGNRVRLLRDAAENYPAWLETIRNARQYIYFETYIIHEDQQGEIFASALAERAEAGVHVFVLYDWLGGVGNTSRAFWRRLRTAGVTVRVFNPPTLTSAFAWVNRDHRKVICVDGDVAFVSGLCVGQMWVGEPARGREPWRDTGAEIRGPAVAAVESAFDSAWTASGSPLPPRQTPDVDRSEIVDGVGLRVIAGEPRTAGLYRLDKLVAALARRSLWLTDAYFVADSSYVQALIAAAKDGVDVRLLVPGSSDLPLVRNLSRAGYRPLLAGGVRVFEWNGTMLHAKTAVADGHWGRVGSTNLNIASWLGNWELDVAFEDDDLAHQLEEMFLADLQHSTEIVLRTARRMRVLDSADGSNKPGFSVHQSTGRALAGAVGIGRIAGALVVRRRLGTAAESGVLSAGAAAMFVISGVALWFPLVVSIPIAVLSAWVGFSLVMTSRRFRKNDP